MNNIDEERQRLLERLEIQKAQLKGDVEGLKDAARPKNILRNLVSDLGKGLRDSKSASDGLKLAAGMLPSRLPYKPVFYVALRYVLPYVLNHYPQIREFATKQGLNAGFTQLRSKLPKVRKSTILGTLKDGVGSLRRRLHQARMDRQVASLAQQPGNGEVHHIGSFTAGSPY
jgi:hypothetical protein